MTRLCAAYGVVGLLRSKATPSPTPQNSVCQMPVGLGVVRVTSNRAEPIATQTGEVALRVSCWFGFEEGLVKVFSAS
jgi:hypothetical protein